MSPVGWCISRCCMASLPNGNWTLNNRSLFQFARQRKFRKWQLVSQNRNASLVCHLSLWGLQTLSGILYLSVSSFFEVNTLGSIGYCQLYRFAIRFCRLCIYGTGIYSQPNIASGLLKMQTYPLAVSVM